MKHKVERYAPQWHLNQCYKCHGFGHRATFCKRKEKCGKGSKEDHTTANCTANKYQYVNCKGEHEAWHATILQYNLAKGREITDSVLNDHTITQFTVFMLQ